MRIRDAALGQKILISFDSFKQIATVIATRSGDRGNFCIGWEKDDPDTYHGAWIIADRVVHDIDMTVSNFDMYHKGYWVGSMTECWECIDIPGQVCVGCNTEAPHVKPNLPENKFICVSCKAERAIDAMPPPLTQDQKDAAYIKAVEEKEAALRAIEQIRYTYEKSKFYKTTSSWDDYSFERKRSYYDDIE